MRRPITLGLKNSNIPPHYGLKEGKGHSSKKHRAGALLHAATVVLPHYLPVGGKTIPRHPRKRNGRSNRPVPPLQWRLPFSFPVQVTVVQVVVHVHLCSGSLC